MSVRAAKKPDRMEGPMSSGDQAGLTLAELLVVLAITALLFSLALPELASLRRAQDEAQARAEQRVVDRAASDFAWERGIYNADAEALARAAYLQRGWSPPLLQGGDDAQR